MIDACRRAGVRLGAIFPQRFNPVNLAIREAACAGRFGALAVVHASVPWWRDDAYYAPNRWQGKAALDGGGALMNQAIHTIDQMLWLAGATMADLPRDANPVTQVFAHTAKRGHDATLIEVEDTAVVTMTFRNGSFGQLLAATSMWPGTKRRLIVAGRDGTAEIFEDQLIQFQFRDERAGDAETRRKFANATTHGGGASNPMAMSHVNHRENMGERTATPRSTASKPPRPSPSSTPATNRHARESRSGWGRDDFVRRPGHPRSPRGLQVLSRCARA
jgi:predicted dehydrogenase